MMSFFVYWCFAMLSHSSDKHFYGFLGEYAPSFVYVDLTQKQAKN